MKKHGFKQGVLWAVFSCNLILMGLTIPAWGESKKGEKAMSISNGKEISIEYTLKLEDQSVVDTNVGDKPLTYIHGSHQIIPGLEKEMDGMKIGESKRVTVKPEDGYGPPDPNAFIEADKKLIPPDALKVNTMLEAQDGNGRTFTARVSEIKDSTVVLDLNHPLAGKTLFFEVKVLNIQEAKQP